jgi:hypothetical protein
MRRSSASQSLARGLVMYIFSHLSSHLLQILWREVKMTLLNCLLHLSFLLPFQVILFHRFVFFCFRRTLAKALIRDCFYF